MRRNKSKKPEPKNTMLLASLLTNLQLKRVSYSYQLLKQFYLFPDDTDSSQKTVDRYDRLIFSDEEIHTMFKKIETKLLGTKMWAFLNIKYFRIVKALHIMERPVLAIQKKKSIENMDFCFTKIKIYSEVKSKKFKIQKETDIIIGNTFTPKKLVKKQTQLQYGQKSTPIRETKVFKDEKSSISTRRNRSRSNQNFKIKIDIQQSNISPCHCQQGSSQMHSPSHMRMHSPSGLRIQSQSHLRQPLILEREPPVSYPISHIHPMQPRLSAEKNHTSGMTVASTIRHDGPSSSQVISSNVPQQNMKVYYNDRPILNENDRAVVKNYPKPQDVVQYERVIRHDKQKDIRNQYGTSNVQRCQGNQRIQNIENALYCHECHQRHPCSIPCPARSRSRSGKKVIRLRSSSRNGKASYLQNINQ